MIKKSGFLTLFWGLVFTINTYAQSAPQIVVHEFMYDPPTGSSEYVELHNTTQSPIDIQDWTLSDSRDTRENITTSTFTVQADSFIVLAPDTSLKGDPQYSDIALIDMGSSFPALNNTGDAIVIHNSTGTLVDSVSYKPSWGGEEIAMERRSSSTDSNFQENWGDSPNGFGTPGNPNDIDPDTQPPGLQSLSIPDSTSLSLKFTERLEQSSASSTSNYTLNTGPGISGTTFTAPDSVQLELSGSLQNNANYTLSIANIADIFGNQLNQDTTFSYFQISIADSGDVVVNEFMAAPPTETSEYIELYNHSSKSLDLQDWTLSDSRESPSTISYSQFVLPPDSFVVLAPDQSLLSTYPNIALINMGSRFPALNNTGDKISIHNNKVLLDSITYSSDWIEDGISLERRSEKVSGNFRSNWDYSPNGFGTPGSQNTVPEDTEPPRLQSLAIDTPTELTLTFSERIKEAGAEQTANYDLPNGPSISTASFSALDSVSLQLSSPLQNARDYTLTIDNVSDIFENTAPEDTTFTFYEISPVDSGDVFINEFSFEPQSGNTEFIEIFNTSTRAFDLQNWKLSDSRGNRSIITQETFVLPPDSFVVVAPDNTLLTDNPTILLVAMSGFPALNNSGDNIVIHGPGDSTLDSLQYASDWGGDKVSLERRTVSIPAYIRENWAVSPSDGTPGSSNTVSTDNTPPFFEDLFAIDDSKLQLIFSEQITSSSATNKQNFQISPPRDIQLIIANEDSVQLILSEEMVSEETYEVTATNITDIFGNTLSGATRSTTYLRFSDAQPGDIVINEIMNNPGPKDSDFIEIYNTTDKNFQLENWAIGDANSEAAIDSKYEFRGKNYLVLTGSDRFASSLENAADVPGFPSYNNSEDAVYLKTPSGQTIDSLKYSQDWGDNIDGKSLERKDPKAASNDPSNWESSSSVSAGFKNTGFSEDQSPPEVIFSKLLQAGIVEVHFSEFIQHTEELKFLMDGKELTVSNFDSTNADAITLNTPSSKGSNSTGPSITVQNLSDVKGNISPNSEIAIAQPLKPTELVINEIMFNPLDDSDDNNPDQAEYIELRNTTDHAVSLEGLFLHDAPDEDGETRDLLPVSSESKWVTAQGKVLIHADTSSTFTSTKISDFFGLESADPQSVMRVDRSSLSLAARDDAIFISDSAGATIDSVYYDEGWHNPNVIDTRGIALERVSPNGPSNTSSNWGSSVAEKGGTPNRENSLYQENVRQTEENDISFTPNPFSPDSDGFEDNLFINYKLDQQDYLLKVRIYDRYGRLVQKLADGKRAGLEGQLIWDGSKDDRGRNRIGIYIVVFEAYGSATGDDKTFKKTVVLARKLN